MKDKIISAKEVAALFGRKDGGWATTQARMGNIKGAKKVRGCWLFPKSAVYEQLGLSGEFDEVMTDYMLTTNRQIADAMGVSQSTVRHLLKDGQIPNVQKIPDTKTRKMVSKHSIYEWLGLKGTFDGDYLEEVKEK